MLDHLFDQLQCDVRFALEQTSPCIGQLLLIVRPPESSLFEEKLHIFSLSDTLYFDALRPSSVICLVKVNRGFISEASETVVKR